MVFVLNIGIYQLLTILVLNLNFSPSAVSRRAVELLMKVYVQVLVNRLEDKACPGSVRKLMTMLDMTLMG